MLEIIRNQHNLSKAEMIEILGITKSYYSMITSGDRKISKKLALRVKDKFGTSLDDIFFAIEVHVATTERNGS